jgi:hypothetical protein
VREEGSPEGLFTFKPYGLGRFGAKQRVPQQRKKADGEKQDRDELGTDSAPNSATACSMIPPSRSIRALSMSSLTTHDDIRPSMNMTNTSAFIATVARTKISILH